MSLPPLVVHAVHVRVIVVHKPLLAVAIIPDADADFPLLVRVRRSAVLFSFGPATIVVSAVGPTKRNCQSPLINSCTLTM